MRLMKPAFQRAPVPDGVDDPMVQADRRQLEQLTAAQAARGQRLLERGVEHDRREATLAERDAVRENHRAEAGQRRAARQERPR